jgi:hypothetical protein
MNQVPAKQTKKVQLRSLKQTTRNSQEGGVANEERAGAELPHGVGVDGSDGVRF